MLIQLLCVGKTHSAYLGQGIDEYTKRINKYSKFEVSILPDIKTRSSITPEQRKQEEGKLILQHLQPGDWVVLLDEQGKTYTSEKFADQWQQWFNRGPRQIICIVGGPYGFSQEVYNRSNASVSLSAMTFSHEMVRLFFAEQLYRAFTIIKKEPYHHR
jgi:23S rRNA (pseudouridine1915-N3)-methyltransferase